MDVKEKDIMYWTCVLGVQKRVRDCREVNGYRDEVEEHFYLAMKPHKVWSSLSRVYTREEQFAGAIWMMFKRAMWVWPKEDI